LKGRTLFQNNNYLTEPKPKKQKFMSDTLTPRLIEKGIKGEHLIELLIDKTARFETFTKLRLLSLYSTIIC